MSRELKFRVWDKSEKCWSNYGVNFVCEFEKKTFEFSGSKHQIQNYVFQQFTGLKDKNGKDIYEGDVVKFKYFVGDQAWENMTDDEAIQCNMMIGNEHICEVKWTEMNCGFTLISGEEKSTHIGFPMLYARSGEVIGNIFEKK